MSRKYVFADKLADFVFVLVLSHELLLEPFDELSQDLKYALLHFGLSHILSHEAKDFSKVILSVFAGELSDIFEDDAVGLMSVPSPHFYELFEACSDGFGGVLNVGVPDLVGSESRHFQIVVF